MKYSFFVGTAGTARLPYAKFAGLHAKPPVTQVTAGPPGVAAGGGGGGGGGGSDTSGSEHRGHPFTFFLPPFFFVFVVVLFFFALVFLFLFFFVLALAVLPLFPAFAFPPRFPQVQVFETVSLLPGDTGTVTGVAMHRAFFPDGLELGSGSFSWCFV
jgi:hypothetical protein